VSWESLRAVLEPLPKWRSRARCTSREAELFFPSPGTAGATSENRAKAICHECDVRRECLLWALMNDEVHGIWGGFTPEEREVFVTLRSWTAVDE